ncbi:hypothetical protein [Halomonas urumqiensis]|uniref:Uncharacterized protein n=1 Tax=Halomonas urumqiensis TaxID=1684789 RepID=A0A2N7UD27_9GAMM|nr:hypothetical protein [Halomonas urumqiensis]PMR78291.1 hypothetical protein C1H70_16140 [Halomonas urumqiensis]PTB03438.1 hypothetical protein C6V82_02775 [Halomonas urumqiensis]GHE20381.1 hypothetical protein GCM10017767_09020 [Halomonas urumqiensis]
MNTIEEVKQKKKRFRDKLKYSSRTKAWTKGKEKEREEVAIEEKSNKKIVKKFDYEILDSGGVHVTESQMRKSLREEDLQEMRDFFNSMKKI